MNTKLTYGKNQIAWRRAQVLELEAKGLTYMEIAKTLQISHSTVGNDLDFIKQQAQEHLHNHIQETIPAEYWRAMASMNSILKMAWAIVSRTEDDRTKIQGLALIYDCTKARVDLSTNSVVISDAMKYIQQKTEQLSELNTLQKLGERIDAAEGREEETTANGIY